MNAKSTCGFGRLPRSSVASLTLLFALGACKPGGVDPIAESSAPSGAQPVSVVDPLIVHEWGTFTSMQGSAGADLEGLQHETESLPAFVHSSTIARVSPFH